LGALGQAYRPLHPQSRSSGLFGQRSTRASPAAPADGAARRWRRPRAGRPHACDGLRSCRVPIRRLAEFFTTSHKRTRHPPSQGRPPSTANMEHRPPVARSAFAVRAAPAREALRPPILLRSLPVGSTDSFPPRKATTPPRQLPNRLTRLDLTVTARKYKNLVVVIPPRRGPRAAVPDPWTVPPRHARRTPTDPTGPDAHDAPHAKHGRTHNTMNQHGEVSVSPSRVRLVVS
jgi:hypothetical protein